MRAGHGSYAITMYKRKREKQEEIRKEELN